jgi:C4-dicarboxylate-specific signal transduction histidine kinase
MPRVTLVSRATKFPSTRSPSRSFGIAANYCCRLLISRYPRTDSFGLRIEERMHVLNAKTVHLDECKTSQKRDEVTADVAGRVADREILVEITVFHRLMPEKLDRLIATGISSLQIDLSEFKVSQATRAKIEVALFENPMNRHWLHHPRMEEARREAQAKLDAKLEQRRAEWERAEEKRQEEHAKRQARTRRVSILSTIST